MYDGRFLAWVTKMAQHYFIRNRLARFDRLISTFMHIATAGPFSRSRWLHYGKVHCAALVFATDLVLFTPDAITQCPTSLNVEIKTDSYLAYFTERANLFVLTRVGAPYTKSPVTSLITKSLIMVTSPVTIRWFGASGVRWIVRSVVWWILGSMVRWVDNGSLVSRFGSLMDR